MKKNQPPVSEQAAIDLLKRIFAATDADAMSLEEIYKAAGRTDRGAETNRNWLNGIQTKLQYYKLITPVMKFENSRNRLDKFKLTIAGKRVLGRTTENEDSSHDEDQHSPVRIRSLTLDEMLAAVEELRKKYTAFDIELVIKPKDKPM